MLKGFISDYLLVVASVWVSAFLPVKERVRMNGEIFLCVEIHLILEKELSLPFFNCQTFHLSFSTQHSKNFL